MTGRRDGFFGSRAAGNTCLAKALIAAGAMGSAQSRLPLPVPWWRLGAGAGPALAAGIAMAPAWSEGPLRSLLLKFPVGVLW